MKIMNKKILIKINNKIKKIYKSKRKKKLILMLFRSQLLNKDREGIKNLWQIKIDFLNFTEKLNYKIWTYIYIFFNYFYDIIVFNNYI
jgi:hypothetical protein